MHCTGTKPFSELSLYLWSLWEEIIWTRLSNRPPTNHINYLLFYNQWEEEIKKSCIVQVQNLFQSSLFLYNLYGREIIWTRLSNRPPTNHINYLLYYNQWGEEIKKVMNGTGIKPISELSLSLWSLWEEIIWTRLSNRPPTNHINYLLYYNQWREK
jgi:hypothetical protein